MTVTEQAAVWIEDLKGRKRRPVKPTTLRLYQSVIRNWIVPQLGTLELGAVTNGAVKGLVSEMVKAELSPVTICAAVRTLQAVLRSVRDPETGNPAYPLVFDREFIDVPLVDRRTQKRPGLTLWDVERAIAKSEGQYRALYALLAGTGLRISEALAIRVGYRETVTAWEPTTATVSVRTQVYRGADIGLKTHAATREVELCAALNDFLIAEMLKLDRKAGDMMFQGSGGRVAIRQTVSAASLQKLGIPGFHAFRRYRLTWLRRQGVHEDIIKYWLGHGWTDITDRYSKLGEDVKARKDWAEKAGIEYNLEAQ